jgi:hypothetical protein
LFFHQVSRSSALFLAALALLLSTGCSSPKEFRGRVISSDYSSAEFTNVEDGDPALLSGSGIPGARIELIRDPSKLSREMVASGTSGSDGVFRIPVDAFGAGWMDETWLFRCTHPQYPMIELFGEMPRLDSDRVLRIYIGTPGSPGSGGRQVEEAERIRRELDRYGS